MATRIDLSRMPGARTRGEVSRFDLEELFAALEPQTVNREAKRDREDVVADTGMLKGTAREAIGQALLLGYGDDIEGAVTGRHADDIRRERNRFADENRLAANAAYAGGLVAGGFAPRAVRAIAGAGRAAGDIEPPRFEPDLRQAMRRAGEADEAARPADSQRDMIERLLSSPEARADVRGRPMELSPADIFTMTAGAEQYSPALPPEEEALRSMSPVDALRFSLDSQAPVDEATRSRNIRTSINDALSVIPGPANVLSARDAFQGAEDAGAAFGEGRPLAGLGNSALAALGAFGAVAGLPTSSAARSIGVGAKDSLGMLIPAPASKAADRARQLREEGVNNRYIHSETGRFFGPEGQVRMEISDRDAIPTLSRFSPGDETTFAEAFNHPALYGVMPELRDVPLKVEDLYRNVNGLEGIARSVGETPSISVGMPEAWDREQLAKLLQYEIAKRNNFGAALTHKTGDMARQYDDAVSSVREIADAPLPSEDLGAAQEWLRRAEPMRDDLARAAGGEGNPWKTTKRASQATAGNADARIVRTRANASPELMRTWGPFPYNQGINWDAIQVLPQPGSSREDVARMLAQWQDYGAGAGR